MTRSVLLFRLLPGKRDEFVATFRRLEVLRRSSSQPGFRRGQLQVRADGADEVLVTADWDSPAAYQGWLDNPVREEIGEHLAPFLESDPEPRVYELVQDVVPSEEEQ
ncbi:MAG TPA: antibiotic biosynthesis monooxygenase family protein [Gaiellaceae bacterium]